jgi:hypothetical protein
VSYGGTNLLAGSTAVLTQFIDLASVIKLAGKILTATWAAGIVTCETENPLDGVIGSQIPITITGFDPETFNGSYVATLVTPTSFTYQVLTDPGLAVTMGQYQYTASSYLNAQVATYFRQGTSMILTVLELGPQTSVAEEIAALEVWLNNNPGAYYGYLLPYSWGDATNISDALTLFEQFESADAMVYFWLTIREDTIGLIPPTAKCVVQLIEAPSVELARNTALPGEYAEFTIAGMFYQAMQYRATSVTRMAPMCFRYIYGVTPYPTQNNGPLLLSFKEKHVNYIQTGAQGGINYTNVYQGVTADGFDYFNWWWTIDWVQLTINADLSNAVINAANNPLSPLYYDQGGINFLSGTLAATMFKGSQFGMINGAVSQTKFDSSSLAQQIQLGAFAGSCNVNAVPFNAYTTQNPTDYARGEYDGLSTLFVPARGFVHILVVVVASNLVSA